MLPQCSPVLPRCSSMLPRCSPVLLQCSLSTPSVLPQYSLSTSSVLPQYFLSTPSVLPQYSLSTSSVLPLKRPCSLSRPGTAIPHPKFGVYIIYIYVLLYLLCLSIVHLLRSSTLSFRGCRPPHLGVLWLLFEI